MGKYKLDDIFDLQMGKTPARNNPVYWNDGCNAWVSIADLSNYSKYVNTTKETISDVGVRESGIKKVPNETVIMSFKLSLGKLAITTQPIYTNEAIMAFIDKKIIDILPNYIFYLFSWMNWAEGTNKAVKGITLNKSTLKNYEINVPPLPVQEKIADVLDRANALIEKRKAQITKLDLLVKSQFVEMFGNIKENRYNFPVMALHDVCNKITDGKHSGCEGEFGSGYFFVGAREISNGNIQYDTAKEITASDFFESYRRCNIEIGDFVIVNTGATIGKTAIAVDSRTTRTLLQKSVALLKTKSEKLLPIFLQYCYITNPAMYRVESASAQPNLLLSKIKATEIILPPLDMQICFVNFVRHMEVQKTQLKKSLALLELNYKSLMQKCFKGEVQ